MVRVAEHGLCELARPIELSVNVPAQFIQRCVHSDTRIDETERRREAREVDKHPVAMRVESGDALPDQSIVRTLGRVCESEARAAEVRSRPGMRLRG